MHACMVRRVMGTFSSVIQLASSMLTAGAHSNESQHVKFKEMVSAVPVGSFCIVCAFVWRFDSQAGFLMRERTGSAPSIHT